MINGILKRALGGALLVGSLCSSGYALATIVQFQTSLGDFEVNLYDDQTPETVQNFLSYIEIGAYQSSLVHRLADGFVVQGGGFLLVDDSVQPVATPWSPINEPVFANVRGTIAMAKLANDPDSATSQWFINLDDNTENLDAQNGGFSVFGQVVGNGMDVVDAIAALNRYNLAGVFGEERWAGALANTPLRAGPETPEEFLAAMDEYLVIIEDIVVIDATEETAVELDRPLSTYDPSEPNPSSPATSYKKKKSGALDSLTIFLLSILGFGQLGLMRRKN